MQATPLYRNSQHFTINNTSGCSTINSSLSPNLVARIKSIIAGCSRLCKELGIILQCPDGDYHSPELCFNNFLEFEQELIRALNQLVAKQDMFAKSHNSSQYEIKNPALTQLILFSAQLNELFINNIASFKDLKIFCEADHIISLERPYHSCLVPDNYIEDIQNFMTFNFTKIKTNILNNPSIDSSVANKVLTYLAAFKTGKCVLYLDKSLRNTTFSIQNSPQSLSDEEYKLKFPAIQESKSIYEYAKHYQRYLVKGARCINILHNPDYDLIKQLSLYHIYFSINESIKICSSDATIFHEIIHYKRNKSYVPKAISYLLSRELLREIGKCNNFTSELYQDERANLEMYDKLEELFTIRSFTKSSLNDEKNISQETYHQILGLPVRLYHRGGGFIYEQNEIETSISQS